MKKLIIAILFIISLSSCDHGFKEQIVTEKDRVPLDYSDSTNWIDSKVYYQPDYMYVKTGRDVYYIAARPPYMAYIVFFLISLLIGMAIGLKISE